MIYTEGPKGCVGIRLSDLLLILGISQKEEPLLYVRVLEEFFHVFSLRGIQSNTIPPCFFEGLQALRETHEKAPDGLHYLMPLFVFLKRCRMTRHVMLGTVGWSHQCRLYAFNDNFIDPNVDLRFLIEGQEGWKLHRNATFLPFDASIQDGIGGYFNPVSVSFEIAEAVHLVYEGNTPLDDHFRAQNENSIQAYILFPERKGKGGIVPLGALHFEFDFHRCIGTLTSETVLQLEAYRGSGAWLVLTEDRFDSSHRFNPKNKSILLSPLPDIVSGAREYVFQSRYGYLTNDGLRQFVPMPTDLVTDLMARYPNICVGEDYISLALRAYEKMKLLHFMTDAPGASEGVQWPAPNWEADFEKEFRWRLERLRART